MATATDTGCVLVFAADDEHLRRTFDHELGAYLHSQRGGWDASAITDLLDLLGRSTTRVVVELQPLPGGRLSVALRYELPVGQGSRRTRPVGRTIEVALEPVTTD